MNVAEKSEALINWLSLEMNERGARGFVVGLSGGIDSAVAIALCKRACPDHTLGVIMPCHSNPEDPEHAKLVADAIGVSYKEILLDEPFELMVKLLTGNSIEPGSKDMAIINIKPRLRMTTLYHFAAKLNYLVVGTGNRSELTVGYFTKFGDGGADLLPLANLVKKDVRELANYLGVPQIVIDKPPSAGLWTGQADESEMGITYEQLDTYILTGKAEPQVREAVDRMALASMHKKQLPVTPPLFSSPKNIS